MLTITSQLRFGVWVEIQEHGSWRWSHWGCVTGKKLQNMREYLDPNGTGDYRWDMLDGYDDEGKGGLAGRPDLQEKVRRCITQGYIDAEDWKGVSSIPWIMIPQTPGTIRITIRVLDVHATPERFGP